MPLAPARNALEAGLALRRLRPDIVHAHLTAAELAAVVTRRRTGARIIATRHIAAPRGKSRAGGAATPYLERHLDLEIAVSEYVRDRIDRPAVVLHNGVRSAALASPSTTVLVAQRLEPEKHTAIALEAFRRSELARQGWDLQVCGDGAERRMLEARNIPGVRFLGWQPDVHERLSRAGALLAPAPGEPLGLTVLEAMARGVPVVAAGAGGHLETLGRDWPGLFPAGDVGAAAERLRQLPDGTPLQARQRALFSLERHLDRLLELYASV